MSGRKGNTGRPAAAKQRSTAKARGPRPAGAPPRSDPGVTPGATPKAVPRPVPPVVARPAPASSAGELPRPVRTAVAILLIESVALVVLTVILVWKTVTGHPDSVARALLDAAMPLLGAVVVALGARGLRRGNGAARTPVVVVQLLAIPVSYSLAFQAGLVGYGAPILIAALAVLYLLFTPPARAALDREPPGGGRPAN